MANPATAHEQLFALRGQIARIEGRLAQNMEADPDAVLIRRSGIAAGDLVPLGAPDFDRALGGGAPRLGLTEIHAAAMRDAAAASGFALALLLLILGGGQAVSGAGPLLWIATEDFYREAGRPYAPGLVRRFGLAPERLMLATAPKPVDALWIAEEAASSNAFSAMLVEISGNPRELDLTATRRLHRRALQAGQPMFLLRAAAHAQATAAPLRLIVSPAAAQPRNTLSGPLVGSIGPPAFDVAIGKSRTARPATTTLEWSHGAFLERPSRHAALPSAVAALSDGGADDAAALRQIVAFPGAGPAAAGLQPSREQHAAGDGARRTG